MGSTESLLLRIELERKTEDTQGYMAFTGWKGQHKIPMAHYTCYQSQS